MTRAESKARSTKCQQSRGPFFRSHERNARLSCHSTSKPVRRIASRGSSHISNSAYLPPPPSRPRAYIVVGGRHRFPHCSAPWCADISNLTLASGGGGVYTWAVLQEACRGARIPKDDSRLVHFRRRGTRTGCDACSRILWPYFRDGPDSSSIQRGCSRICKGAWRALGLTSEEYGNWGRLMMIIFLRWC